MPHVSAAATTATAAQSPLTIQPSKLTAVRTRQVSAAARTATAAILLSKIIPMYMPKERNTARESAAERTRAYIRFILTTPPRQKPARGATATA